MINELLFIALDKTNEKKYRFRGYLKTTSLVPFKYHKIEWTIKNKRNFITKIEI